MPVGSIVALQGAGKGGLVKEVFSKEWQVRLAFRLDPEPCGKFLTPGCKRAMAQGVASLCW
jgi:hypothetical protein